MGKNTRTKAGKPAPGRKSEQGQSTLEFALTVLLFIPFILFYLQISLVFGFANYVHYAVFMSARAYLSSGPDIEDQKQRAKDVIVLTLKRSQGQAGVDKFPSLGKAAQSGDSEIKGMEIVEPAPDAGDSLSWEQGIRYRFSSRIFMVPMLGAESSTKGGSASGANMMKLAAESFLLRETNEKDCQTEMNKRSKGIYDNGC